MRELAKELGIPKETFQRWIEKDPSLAVYIPGGPGNGSWWIKLDKLEGRAGITLQDAYTLGSRPWMKATLLAKKSGISRRTIAHWCRTRPGFGKRLGRIWYVDLEEFGANPEQIAKLLGIGSNEEP